MPWLRLYHSKARLHLIHTEVYAFNDLLLIQAVIDGSESTETRYKVVAVMLSLSLFCRDTDPQTVVTGISEPLAMLPSSRPRGTSSPIVVGR